jgi:hypothetical protein
MSNMDLLVMPCLVVAVGVGAAVAEVAEVAEVASGVASGVVVGVVLAVVVAVGPCLVGIVM